MNKHVVKFLNWGCIIALFLFLLYLASLASDPVAVSVIEVSPVVEVTPVVEQTPVVEATPVFISVMAENGSGSEVVINRNVPVATTVGNATVQTCITPHALNPQDTDVVCGLESYLITFEQPCPMISFYGYDLDVISLNSRGLMYLSDEKIDGESLITVIGVYVIPVLNHPNGWNSVYAKATDGRIYFADRLINQGAEFGSESCTSGYFDNGRFE